MESVKTITNEAGQTLQSVDDIREIWINPECPYSMFGAKLVGHATTRVSQTIDGCPVSDECADQFIRRAQEEADKIREREERAQLARLKEKYED